MILKNKAGKERNVNVLFEVEINGNKYVVFRDKATKNVYSSKYVKDNELNSLNTFEYEIINNILERMNG